jgi:hypothetical protein
MQMNTIMTINKAVTLLPLAAPSRSAIDEVHQQIILQ